MGYHRTWWFLSGLILLAFSHPSAVFPASEPATLLEQMDNVMRGKSHEMTVTLDVKTKNWERHYKIKVWMKGVDFAFARVMEPAKAQGQGFLRIKTRLWNYLPTAERTILIPPSAITLLGDLTSLTVNKICIA